MESINNLVKTDLEIDRLNRLIDIDTERYNPDSWEMFLDFGSKTSMTLTPSETSSSYVASNKYDLQPEDLCQVEKILNCTVIKHIGHGGFATVKEVISKATGEKMAIKIVRK